jgi:hypothetical protein
VGFDPLRGRRTGKPRAGNPASAPNGWLIANGGKDTFCPYRALDCLPAHHGERIFKETADKARLRDVGDDVRSLQLKIASPNLK